MRIVKQHFTMRNSGFYVADASQGERHPRRRRCGKVKPGKSGGAGQKGHAGRRTLSTSTGRHVADRRQSMRRTGVPQAAGESARKPQDMLPAKHVKCTAPFSYQEHQLKPGKWGTDQSSPSVGGPLRRSTSADSLVSHARNQFESIRINSSLEPFNPHTATTPCLVDTPVDRKRST